MSSITSRQNTHNSDSFLLRTCTLISKLKLGCKLVTLPAFKPDTFVSLLSKHNPTVLHLVPPIVTFMNNTNEVKLEHLKSVRMIMSGAAPLGIANISLLLTTIHSLLTVTGRSEVERFRDSKAPQVKFSQGYGLTESSPVAMMQAIGNMVLNFTLPFLYS